MAKPVDYTQLIQLCEDNLRKGRVFVVSKTLAQLNTAAIPRELRLPLANICWRAGLLRMGMKILTPVIRIDTRQEDRATDKERAEYSVFLNKLGATAEALNLLRTVNGAKCPDALLYQAFCHFANWDYAEAIPILRQFVVSQIPEYRRLVGNVNLAAALVVEGHSEMAESLLAQNLTEAKAGNHHRLFANSLEIRSQYYLRSGEFDKARADLNEAKHLLASAGTYDQFFVRKWRAILDAMEARDLEPIRQLKVEAAHLADWETLREADRFGLTIQFDPEVFARIMFGTPSAAYRKRLMQDFPDAQLPDEYIHGSAEGALLHLTTGEVIKGPTAALNPGKKCHQLLSILAGDFYRPLRLGAIFTDLFPGEHYDFHSSPGKVHGWLWRTRNWLGESGLPVGIVMNKDGSYQFEIGPGAGILVSRERLGLPTNEQVQWERLRIRLSTTRFNAKNAQSLTQIPRTSMQRLIKWALAEGKIRRIGAGNQVEYEVISEVAQSESRAA